MTEFRFMRLETPLLCFCLLSLESISYAQIAEVAKLTSFGNDVSNYFGVSVAIGDRFWAVGDWLNDDFEEDGGSVSVFYGPGIPAGQLGDELFPTDGVPVTLFGSSISACGSRIAVASDSRTFVFRYDHGRWTQEVSIPFGSTSVSLTESYLAIGVPSSPVGFVATYQLDHGFDAIDMSDDQWIGELPILGPGSGDYFGQKVAMDHDRIVVGAPSGLVNGLQTGIAYVFERAPDGTGWVETARLEPIGATEGADFGRALSVRGDRILVGAPLDHPTGAGAGRGSAYVYCKDAVSQSWKSQGRLIARDGGDDDLFGVSVAIGREAVFVGAHFAEDGQVNHAGAVYQFGPGPNHDSTARWHLVGKFTPNDVKAGDLFGRSMTYGADALLVGAPGAAKGGAAYIFSVD